MKNTHCLVCVIQYYKTLLTWVFANEIVYNFLTGLNMVKNAKSNLADKTGSKMVEEWSTYIIVARVMRSPCFLNALYRLFPKKFISSINKSQSLFL